MLVSLTTPLSGMVAAGFTVAGLFFLRFWRRTRDSLFLAFAAAFWLLGLVQALLALTEFPVDERSLIYLIRLIAQRLARIEREGCVP